MLVHLRVISMFVFAFVLVFLASSSYEIYSHSPEKSREAKNSTLRVDQKSVFFTLKVIVVNFEAIFRFKIIADDA